MTIHAADNLQTALSGTCLAPEFKKHTHYSYRSYRLLITMCNLLLSLLGLGLSLSLVAAQNPEPFLNLTNKQTKSALGPVLGQLAQQVESSLCGLEAIDCGE